MVERFRHLAAFLHDVYQEWIKDNGLLFAAAISFYGVVSLVPLLLLAIGVIGHIVGSYETALQRIVEFISNYTPTDTKELAGNLRYLARQSGLLSGIGLVGLIWTGMQVFVILQQVMNIALGAEQRMSYLKVRGIALLTLMVGGVLLGVSIVMTSLLTALRSYNIPGFHLRAPGAFWGTIEIIGPFVATVLAFTLIYRFLPNREIGPISPVIGGISSGVLFEIAKYSFRWYITSFSGFSRVYGPLASLIVLVFWIHFVSIITVVGAEITSVFARHEMTFSS